MGALGELQKKMEKRESKPKRPLPQRPRLIEVFLSRERALPLLIRGIVGLASQRMDLNEARHTEPRPLQKGEKPEYAV